MTQEHKNSHHEDKNNGVIKIAMNLTCACLLSGVIISGVYALTAPVAAKQAVKMKEEAMREVAVGADSFKAIDGKDGWYEAMKDGKVFAYVAPAHSKGYGGEISMVMSVSPDGKVIDYKILKHNETPGLGDNATKPKFRDQFHGKTADQLKVVKTPTDQNIQAMTGATITSKAVTKGVRETAEAVNAYIAQHSAGQKK